MAQLTNNIRVVFEESTHTYLNEQWRELMGVTTLMKKHGLGADYANIDPGVLAKAAARGSKIHKEIEDYCNMESGAVLSTECQAFAKLGLDVIANEYLVSDNETVATMIDVVLADYSLCDIKTTSTFHHQAVSWQLSICAYLFELQNPHLKAGKFYGIHIRNGEAKLIEVERKPRVLVDQLFACEAMGVRFDPDMLACSDDDQMAALLNIERFIAGVELQAKQAKVNRDRMLEKIYTQMEQAGQKKIETDGMTITRILPTTKQGVDSKALQANHPDIYAQVVKTTQVKGSVRITLKD